MKLQVHTAVLHKILQDMLLNKTFEFHCLILYKKCLVRPEKIGLVDVAETSIFIHGLTNDK